MKIYKIISTTKAKDGTGNKPTHYLKAKVNKEDRESEFVASLWAKEFKNPDSSVSKFLSGEMKAQWTDHTDKSKSRKGFVIVEEAELNKLLEAVKVLQGGDTTQTINEEEVINPDDIPF